MTSREEMMKLLGKKLPIVGTTEDFDGSPDGIWICGEGGYSNKEGIPYFDYYDLGGLYTFGVLDELWNYAEKHGWYFEWYDAGTIMAYPD